jgi:hypothetical protein
VDAREKLEADLVVIRQVLDDGLDAGVTDSNAMRTAAKLLRERKEQLRRLVAESPLDLAEERSG